MNQDDKGLALASNLPATPPKKSYEKPIVSPYGDSVKLAQIMASAKL